jgi:monovalent cation:H+ antiporter-2, CPA2 family
LAGIAIGQSGMRWVTPNDPMLDLLAEFGFVFLMFLSGMEIDFASLVTPEAGESEDERTRWGPLFLGSASFLLTMLMSVGVALYLVHLGLANNPWMMALILSTTSLGVVVPVLKERGLSGTSYGQTILIAAVIADLATMLLITVVVAAISRGLTAEILLIAVLFVACFLMYRFGIFLNRISAVRRSIEELSHATSQIKVRAAFTMMLIFIVLSEALGTEVILGAFLAGAIVSLMRTAADLELAHQLEAVGFGFLIPIFFIDVGVKLDLPVLAASPDAILLVPLLLLSAIAVKVIPALVFRLSFNWPETLAAGTLISARLSLIIAAAAIGQRLGAISEALNAAIILVAILTVTASPLLFVRLMPGRGPKSLQPIVILGSNELGLQVAERLRAHHEPVVVIDSDDRGLARARERGIEGVKARPDRPDPDAAPHLQTARAVVCAYEDADLGYRVCRMVQSTYGIDHIVAQVSDPKDLTRFEELGVTTMNAALDRAALMVLLVRNPDIYMLLSRTDDDKEISEVIVSNDLHIGRMIRQLRLPGDVLVLALRRDGELMIPHGDTRLSRNDRLTLVGSVESVETARLMFGKPNHDWHRGRS